MPLYGAIMSLQARKGAANGEEGKNVRAKLQRLREANGYTQQAFSAAVGVSRSHYSQIETGDKQPSLRLALKIKRALNYYGDDIFDNTMPVRK